MERQMALGLILTIAAAGLVLAFTFLQPSMQQAQRSTQLTMSVRDGAHLFVASQCFSCHGAQGQGIIGPQLNGTELPIELIVTTITDGRKPSDPDATAMPPFGTSLSAHEIEQLATFVSNWNQAWLDFELAAADAVP